MKGCSDGYELIKGYDAAIAAEKAAGNLEVAAAIEAKRATVRLDRGKREGEFYKKLVSGRWQFLIGRLVLNDDGTCQWIKGEPAAEWVVMPEFSILIRWPTGSYSVADFSADLQNVEITPISKAGGLMGEGRRVEK